MMKRIFYGILVCLFVSVVSAKTSIFGEEIDYKTAKRFYDEFLKFDYCGTNGIVRAERGESHERVLHAMVRFQPEVVLRDLCFYDMLKCFEVLALTGRMDRHSDGQEIGSWLLEFKKQENQSALWNYVSSVEYSLLRILDGGFDKINIKKIENVLPPELYVWKSKISENSHRSAAHKAFKNMIVIAWKLSEWKRNHGSYPAVLKDLDIDSKWLNGIGGADIEYETRNGIWQLFSPGARGGKNKCEFNHYVPVMDAPGVRFWPQSSCLWLSPDFSEKRRCLYETGILYSLSESRCACKLEHGGIFPQ